MEVGQGKATEGKHPKRRHKKWRHTGSYTQPGSLAKRLIMTHDT